MNAGPVEGLRRALLGDAQVRAGPEAGGVAGSLSADRRATYVYGEITGYHLQWLASPREVANRDDYRRAATAALAWAERRYGGETLPPTRIELEGTTDDWRNRAQFCFDLAMLAGGLAAATRAGLVDAPRTLLQALYAHLAPFAAADGLEPYRLDDPTTPALAPRWSTRNGPFLVKAAARLLAAHAIEPMPSALHGAACAHARLHQPASVAPFADPVHPTLYFLEGHLALADHGLDVDRDGAARVLEAIVAVRAPDGTLPESIETPAVRRTDILAQVIRVGVLVEDRLSTRASRALAAIAEALAARVREDGHVPFDPSRTPVQLNVWGAMFAEQALDWIARDAAGRAQLHPRDLV